VNYLELIGTIRAALQREIPENPCLATDAHGFTRIKQLFCESKQKNAFEFRVLSVSIRMHPWLKDFGFDLSKPDLVKR